mmetsp:Transcript_8245/g.25500  ORF Transcript_8245/g.25500 Transcript_8245/m.25500 type:complete len:226 (-) Transcript_8245:458-1135(-)
MGLLRQQDGHHRRQDVGPRHDLLPPLLDRHRHLEHGRERRDRRGAGRSPHRHLHVLYHPLPHRDPRPRHVLLQPRRPPEGEGVVVRQVHQGRLRREVHHLPRRLLPPPLDHPHLHLLPGKETRQVYLRPQRRSPLQGRPLARGLPARRHPVHHSTQRAAPGQHRELSRLGPSCPAPVVADLVRSHHAQRNKAPLSVVYCCGSASSSSPGSPPAPGGRFRLARPSL